MPNHSPAFQFYPNDWLGSTNIMLMSPAEEGAYIRLLAIAWNSPDCGLPDDDSQLSVLSRLGEGWFNGASAKVRACFFSRNNRLYNSRLLQEKKKQDEWRKKSRGGGIQSGKARRLKAKKPEGWLKGGSQMVEPNGNSSSSSSSSIKDNIYTPDFESFYNSYPRRKAKGNAFRAWKKAKNKPSLEELLKIISAQKNSLDWKKENGKYIPFPATWLNQGRWDDDVMEIKRSGPLYGRP